MVFINEWLPNPEGVDTKTEFIELYNSGSAPASVAGWQIATTGKKIFRIGSGVIAPRGYFLLPRTETKLSLKNSGETVSLYDAAGKLVDQSSYIGTALSGKSFARVVYPSNENDTRAGSQSFVWAKPTPGALNQAALQNQIHRAAYPTGVPLNADALGSSAVSHTFTFLALLIGVSAILAALVVYSLKSDEKLSDLFFKRDDGARA